MAKPEQHCKDYLKAMRKAFKAKSEEKIDKRYAGDGVNGYLAPNDKYYRAHCAYCAEVAYLLEIYADKEIEGESE